VERGIFNCYKENEDGTRTLLMEYKEGQMFGELAVIYNCPRTATIIAQSDNCLLFSLDRQTFNYVVRDSTMKRNEKHMKILASVPILETLDHYERSKVLDACRSIEYDEGEIVISEGEEAQAFYILLKGEAIATKMLEDSKDAKVVKHYSSGDYFGERAMLNNTTRAANIIAKTNIECLVLGRDKFKALLGSIEHILKRNMKIYIDFINS
jgi:cAMP-dependent protein kinase regulator